MSVIVQIPPRTDDWREVHGWRQNVYDVLSQLSLMDDGDGLIVENFAITDTLYVDKITEYTLDAGVTIEGVKMQDANIYLPSTTAAPAGTIFVDSERWLHNFGAGGVSDGNVFLGYQAGNVALTGVDNTGLGRNALDTLTSGARNIAVGPSALGVVTTGSDNIALGNSAGGAIVGGRDNILIGQISGSSISSSTENIFIGHSAGREKTTGGASVVIGGLAGGGGRNLGFNVVLGYNAGGNDFIANQSVVIGHEAGYDAGGSVYPNARNTVLIGYRAGYQAGSAGMSDCGSAVIIGSGAASSGTGSHFSTVVIGPKAGLSSGARNVYIGNRAGNLNTGSDKLEISNNTYETSRVVGTDANVYTCSIDHIATNSNRPVTGASWASFWLLAGAGGGAWALGNSYISTPRPLIEGDFVARTVTVWGKLRSLVGGSIIDTGADHWLDFALGEDLSADRTITWLVNDGDRSITFGGDLYIDSVGQVAKTGWPKTPGVTLSFDDGTKTFTVTDGGSAYYYIDGVKYTLGGNKTVVLPGTPPAEGTWFIYFSGSTLTASQTPWVITDDDKALVAYVLWDAANNKGIFTGYELHGYVMDAATHERMHDGGGAAWQTGLAVTDAGAELLDVSTGTFWDEDLPTAITDGAGAALFEQVLTPLESPIYYLSGASDWRIYETADKANATDAGYVNAGDLHYNKLNGAWASAAAGVGKYVAYYILATNEQTEPVITLMGQRIDTTLAQAKANNTFPGMVLGTAPYQEVVVLARAILKATAGAPGYTLEDITDLRSTNAEGNVTSPLITQHDGLGNLAWSLAGHYMDTTLDMLTNAITNCTTINGMALEYTATGNYAIGTGALANLAATPTYNIGIGDDAGNDITDGDYNILIGNSAGELITTQANNVCVGAFAGQDLVQPSGANNTLVGHGAGANPTSSNNTGVGLGALGLLVAGGGRNTAVGAYALWGAGASTKNAAYNVGLGYEAGRAIDSGDGNVFVGYKAGYSTTNGNGNIYVGNYAGYRQTTASNRFIVDNQIRADVATEASDSIIYAVMAAAPASQTLRVNAYATFYMPDNIAVAFDVTEGANSYQRFDTSTGAEQIEYFTDKYIMALGGSDEAINAAIDSLPAGGGEVKLVAGTSTCDAVSTIDVNYTTLAGSGWGTYLDATADQTFHVIDVNGMDYCKIKGLRINGKLAQVGSNSLVYASGSNYLKVEDCFFGVSDYFQVQLIACDYAMVLGNIFEGGGSWTFSNNSTSNDGIVANNISIGGNGISVLGSRNSYFANVSTGTGSQPGFTLSGPNSSMVGLVTYDTGEGFLVGGDFQSLIGCSINKTTKQGVEILANKDHGMMVGCRFFSIANAQVEVSLAAGSDQWQFVGNYFWGGHAEWAISSAGADDALVTGCWSGTHGTGSIALDAASTGWAIGWNRLETKPVLTGAANITNIMQWEDPSNMLIEANYAIEYSAADGARPNLDVLRVLNLEATAGQSKGIYVQAGSTAADYAFDIWDYDASNNLLKLLGDGTISGVAIKDEDNMAADSAGHLATQQSIKAYVDAKAGDVTAAANIGDNLLVRGDGAVKGVQNTGITISDADNVSGMGTLGCGAITSTGQFYLNYGGGLIAKLGSVTPGSSWHTNYDVVEIGYTGSIQAHRASDALYINANAYYDSVDTRWEYQRAGSATQYIQCIGSHSFLVAGAGAAGAALTLNNALVISSDTNARFYGNVGIGVAAAYTLDVLGRIHVAHSAANSAFYLDNIHGSTPYGIFMDFSAASPDNNTQYFLYATDSTTARCIIWSDGDLANHDGVYGTISDERLKQEWTPARDYWTDWKSLQFGTYRMISDVEADANAPTRFGQRASDLAEVFPGLVVDNGKDPKWIKQSIVHEIGSRVLQEAQDRIEELEARLALIEKG